MSITEVGVSDLQCIREPIIMGRKISIEVIPMKTFTQTVREWFPGIGTHLLETVFSVALTLVIGLLIIKAVLRLVRTGLEKTHLEKAAHSLVLSLTKVGLYLLLGMSIAAKLGIDVTGVVALASVLTLAISLALQNMLTNVLGGFALLTTHPFHSGDYVDIGDLSGTVTAIDMTYTRLVTPDNKVVCIPNSTVMSAQVVNYSAQPTRRAQLNIGASYDAPTQKVIDALLEAARAEGALTDPAPFAAVESYGDNAINYILRFWTPTEKYWDLYFAVNQKVKDVFDQAGIEMTYPHVNVHFDREK